jgi:hypothetical protein
MEVAGSSEMSEYIPVFSDANKMTDNNNEWKNLSGFVVLSHAA